MHEFPPMSLYATLSTPEAIKKHPGAPQWAYDGQFIWFVYKSAVKRNYGFGPGKTPYPKGSVGAEMADQYKKKVGM